MILNHLPIFAYSDVEVWYENIYECSKVKNRPFVFSRHEAGAYMYFGHISSLIFFMATPQIMLTNEKAVKGPAS